jgi:hypothetical protein
MKALMVGLLMAALLVPAACQSVLDLKVGDCFDGGEGESVSDVTPKPCDQPHDKEVYATPTYTGTGGDTYPGGEPLTTFAQTQCVTAFQAYVGKDYNDSELDVQYLTPSSDSWGSGDRTIDCILLLKGQKLTGSMKNSNR